MKERQISFTKAEMIEMKTKMKVRKLIHWFVKKLNALLGYRLWWRGEVPKIK